MGGMGGGWGRGRSGYEKSRAGSAGTSAQWRARYLSTRPGCNKCTHTPTSPQQTPGPSVFLCGSNKKRQVYPSTYICVLLLVFFRILLIDTARMAVAAEVGHCDMHSRFDSLMIACRISSVDKGTINSGGSLPSCARCAVNISVEWTVLTGLCSTHDENCLATEPNDIAGDQSMSSRKLNQPSSATHG